MSDELKAKVKTLQAAFVARELELEQVRSNAEARQVTLENQLGALQTQLQSLQTRIDSQRKNFFFHKI
jgi:predicted  nucleic acid-binding Zn-ribbon protein